MARKMEVTNSKTYATEANADKAVAKVYGQRDDLRYYIAWTKEGRCFPVFVGVNCINEGVHFHFNVVG
jgi:hypothetical protein